MLYLNFDVPEHMRQHVAQFSVYLRNDCISCFGSVVVSQLVSPERTIVSPAKCEVNRLHLSVLQN